VWLRRSLVASLAIAGGVMVAARPGAAYVPYRTVDGAGMAWAQNCVPIVVYPSGFSQMTPAAVETAASGGAAAWSAGSNSCTYLDLEVGVSTAPAPAVRNDGINAVVFRTDSWCEMTNGVCTLTYDASAVSVSTVTAISSTGQIIDADVEVNAVDFSWADLDTDPQSTGDQDLQNDLTEAFGHLIGLDAPCYQSSLGLTRPLDNNGQPAVDCDQASAAVQAETMFPAWPPGDTQKRTLAPDDQAGLCGLYPLAANPRSCQVGAGTCSCTVGDASAPTDGSTHNDGGSTGGNAHDGGGSGGNTHDGGAPGGDTHDASAKGTAAAAASGCSCSSAGSPAPYGPLALAVVGIALVSFGRRRARR
jgi:MYXO-CTERM domain-containing protein